MPAVLVRLKPTGPWRVGPDSGDRDRVDRVYHSDALYSAVCAAMERLGVLNEWLDATARSAQPAVRFSSCFPFHQDTLYVVPPRHVWPPAASAKVRWKGARFVPLPAVESLLSGKALSEEAWLVDGESECLMPASPAPAFTLFRAAVRSHAAMDRSGEGVAPHSVACVEFAAGCGVWFVADFADGAAKEDWGERTRAAIRLLADSGFGGERSRGWGRSEMPEFTDGELPDLLLRRAGEPLGETGYYLLSLFHAAETDGVDWERGNYALATRSGRIESSAGWGDHKKSTRMVAEGSVVVASADPRGSATDVAPEGFPHPVYRAGFALALRVPLKVTAAS